MKIYQIDSSARKKGSTSRALAKKLLEKIKKYPNACKWFVIIRIPVINKITPPIFDTRLTFFLKFFENIKNFWIK